MQSQEIIDILTSMINKHERIVNNKRYNLMQIIQHDKNLFLNTAKKLGVEIEYACEQCEDSGIIEVMIRTSGSASEPVSVPCACKMYTRIEL